MQPWKDYHTFNKKERSGIAVLLLLILSVTITKYFLPALISISSSKTTNFEEEIKKFHKGVVHEPKKKGGKLQLSELFYFNPNKLSKEKWRLLGLKDWQIKIIHNYESKGGTFKKKEGLKNIYGIDTELYDRISPYIEIPIPKKNKEKEKVASELFQFNPNNLSKEKWRLLGLKDWQIRIIHNYESKGGNFKSKEDLKKMYGIDEPLYHKLENYISIPGNNSVAKIQLTTSSKLIDLTPENFKGLQGVEYYQESGMYKYTIGQANNNEEAKKLLAQAKKAGYTSAFLVAFKDGQKISASNMFRLEKNKRTTKRGPLVELNAADSTTLVKVRGIGPAFSSRIIKYRNRLGGFLEMEQLKEVYGITEIVYERIAPQITIDVEKVTRININTCPFVRLVEHPYINRNVANSLINYRKKHGLFSKLQEVKKSDLVNEELYSKIAPYLTL